MRTAQETFNFVVGHLAKQKRKAIDPRTKVCQYREEDRSCAVGCLISDELAEDLTKIDGGGSMIDQAAWEKAYPELELSDLDERQAKSFYIRLQTAHDRSYDVDSLSMALTDLAIYFNLDYSKVSEIVEWK